MVLDVGDPLSSSLFLGIRLIMVREGIYIPLWRMNDISLIVLLGG